MISQTHKFVPFKFRKCMQLPAMYTVIFKTKSVEHLSVAPTVGQASNFAMWVVYGIVGNELAVLRVNAVGVGFAVVYICIFLIYATKQNFKILVISLSATIVISTCILAGVIVPTSIPQDTKISILGGIAVACNVVM
jgi:uncharacterized protein with PQ loop repeat